MWQGLKDIEIDFSKNSIMMTYFVKCWATPKSLTKLVLEIKIKAMQAELPSTQWAGLLINWQPVVV